MDSLCISKQSLQVKRAVWRLYGRWDLTVAQSVVEGDRVQCQSAFVKVFASYLVARVTRVSGSSPGPYCFVLSDFLVGSLCTEAKA